MPNNPISHRGRRQRSRPSDTALFAMLLVEEYQRRFCVPEDTTLIAVDVRVQTYLHFLKQQSDTRHDNCYAKAVRLIEAGS